MIKNKGVRIFIVVCFNLFVAVGFYQQNLSATFSNLSTDLHNIIPVAQKFDNPSLYQEDLFVNNIENVRYYTPFYVQSLRFIAKFTDYDYVQALNVYGFFAHVVFGLLWFLLFYKYGKNFWLAFLMSILVRGIVWLPGFEIWGISSLWTLMPRTIYIVLLPLPFLVLKRSILSIGLASFLMGLIFNFHPITGLGGILLWVSFLIIYAVIHKLKEYYSWRFILTVLLALILGMLPFIITYFGKTSTSFNYSLEEFNAAFSQRISGKFLSPSRFLEDWLKFKTLFFVIPSIAYLIISHYRKVPTWKAWLIVLLNIVLIVIPSISVYVERGINEMFDLNLRMSFQIIRAQKLAILPSFFALLFLLEMTDAKLNKKYFSQTLFVVFLVTLIFSKSSVFDKVPFVGDDILRLSLPNNLSYGHIIHYKDSDLDNMANYIKENTSEDAIIYGSYFFRSASKRSVILDSKGMSMLIEGNPEKLIYWYRKKMELKAIKSQYQRALYLKTIGADYMVSKINISELNHIHKAGDLYLYSLE